MIHALLKRNDRIGLDEFVWALNELELSLSEAEYRQLFAHFQKNWNEPKIDWSEFVNTIRGELSQTRLDAIRRAYSKLDVQGVSNVTLDDIARSYDVRGNRDTTSGVRS